MGRIVGASDQPALPYIGSFSLSITQAMREQLMTALSVLDDAPLTTENLESVEKRGGIYQLLLNGQSVYIGKSTKALPSRIAKHHRKISGRSHGLLDDITFKALYVNEDLDALAPEKMLIRAFLDSGQAPWNNNGFGNNDPGKRRDSSLVKVNHFDRLFPVNLDLPVEATSKEPIDNLLEAMSAVKTNLPYVFRFPSVKESDGRELRSIDISHASLAGKSMPVSDWMAFFASHMPPRWMLTGLPGYIIAYKETDPNKYGSRTQVWIPDGIGNFHHETHTPKFENDAVDEEDNSLSDDDDDD